MPRPDELAFGGDRHPATGVAALNGARRSAHERVAKIGCSVSWAYGTKGPASGNAPASSDTGGAQYGVYDPVDFGTGSTGYAVQQSPREMLYRTTDAGTTCLPAPVATEYRISAT